MYLHEIIWFLSWPVLIAVSYFAIRWALRLLDKVLSK